MSFKFCKIENVELNDGDTAILSLTTSSGDIQKGKLLTINFRPTQELTNTRLTFDRKQARQLQKVLTKWINGDPLVEVN
jgi:hypothetical protein